MNSAEEKGIWVCLEEKRLVIKISRIQGDKVAYSNLYNAFSEYCDNISEPLNICGLSLGGVLALNQSLM